MNFLVTLITHGGATHTEWAPMYPVPHFLTRAERAVYADLPEEVKAIVDAGAGLPILLRRFVFTGKANDMGARVYHEVLNSD